IPANRRRSCYASSSSSPSPRKGHKASPYSSSSASLSSSLVSIRPSRKRCRSPAASVPAVVPVHTSLLPTAANLLPPRKRLRYDPVVPPVHAEPTIGERLDEQTLKDRAETPETERTNLRERVRSLETSALSLRDTLRIKRERCVRIEHQLGFVTEELIQSRIAYFTDKESLMRMETFLCRRFNYRMTTTAIKRLVNQRVADALAAQEANRNNRNGNKNVNDNVNGNENENREEENVNIGGNARGVAPVARACTYKDFLNC
ncbi:hypothetical protein Tco_1573309, partial [Tanacetum coccineum]